MIPNRYKSLVPPNKPEQGQRNAIYTRQTIDPSATFYDARKVSLNGWLLYHAIKAGATSMVPKGISKVVKQMVRQSAIMMPIRQLATFSSGRLTDEGVAAVILIIKGKLFQGLKLLRQDLKATKHRKNKADLYRSNDITT